VISPSRYRAIACGVALICAGIARIAGAEMHHVVLCGSGGEAEFEDRFREWGTRLRDVLIARLEADQGRVTLLMEPQAGSPGDTDISLAAIDGLFEELARRMGPADDIAIYMIGHGSFLKDESKFQIPGEDLSAKAFEAMIAELPASRVIVVNGTSSSAGFVNALSAPNRVICTATKSVSEANATEFMRFYIESLEDGSADRDHDERISVLEACEQAAELTASWYTGMNLISTEHAILDDNGDGLGTRLPVASVLDEGAPVDAAIDGSLAASIYLKDYSFPEAAPQELIDRYLSALDAVAALRSRKRDLAESDYYAELERLLIDAARANREIRGYASSREDS
jgi:hypothetical protein